MTFILVILTVVIIISFELLRKTRHQHPQVAPGLVAEFPGPVGVSDRYFHPGHAWVTVTNSETKVTVGTDDFSQRLVGTLSGIELPRVGQRLRQGEPFAELRHGNRILVQTSPVSGIVAEVNDNVRQDPTIVNDSPLDKGWLTKIIPSSLRADLRNLLIGATADAWRAAVRTQLVQLYTPNIGTVLQDGGELVKNFANQISDDEWTRLVREFYPCVSNDQTLNKSQN